MNTMNRAIKILMNNTVVSRNWTILLNYVGTRATSTLPNNANVQGTPSREELKKLNYEIQEYISSNANNDPKCIMQNIKQNYKNMGAKEAITVMVALQKTRNYKLDYDSLLKTEEFSSMCQIILKNVRSLNIYQMIHGLNILLSYKVPLNSIIIQTLLQFIRIYINDLTVSEIINLYYILKRQKEIPLVTSLLYALPIAFKTQIKVELYKDDTRLLIKALTFACNINDKEATQYIIDVLSEAQMNVHCIAPVYRALSMLPTLSPVSLKLLHKVENLISVDSLFLTFNDTSSVIHAISRMVAQEQMDFYNVAVINRLCDIIINNVNFVQGLKILSSLNVMQYSHVPLLDYLAAICLTDTSLLGMCTNIELYTLIRGFVIADHKSSSWESIQEMLLNRLMDLDYPLQNALSVAFYIISLDCYCPKFLEYTFNLYNSTFGDSNDTLTFKQKQWVLKYHILHQCVKTLYPQFGGDTFKENTVNQEIESNEIGRISSLKECLEEALGGTEYIKSDARTRFGNSPGHIIVMQSDGTPMVSNDSNNITNFEELVTSAKNHKFIVLLIYDFPKKAYSINLQTLQSTWKTQLKSMEALTGFKTLAINPYLWQEFSKQSRVEYLQQAIKSKLAEYKTLET